MTTAADRPLRAQPGTPTGNSSATVVPEQFNSKATQVLSSGLSSFKDISVRRLSLAADAVGVQHQGPLVAKDIVNHAQFLFLKASGELAKLTIFADLETKLGVDRTTTASSALIAFALLVCYTWLSFGTRIVCILLGVLYPSWKSFKAIESPNPSDDTEWLTYWVVYGSTQVLEETAMKLVVQFQPTLYYLSKMVFVAWLVNWGGSRLVYKNVLAPFLRKHEDNIEETLDKTRKRFTLGRRSSSKGKQEKDE